MLPQSSEYYANINCTWNLWLLQKEKERGSVEGREERGGVGTATPGESQKPGQFESCPRRPVRPPQATEDVSELPELGSRGSAHEAGFQGRK